MFGEIDGSAVLAGGQAGADVGLTIGAAVSCGRLVADPQRHCHRVGGGTR